MALTGNDAMSNACKSSGGPVATRPHTLYSRNPRDEMDKRRPAVSRGASASLVDRFHCCFTLFSKKADFFFFNNADASHWQQHASGEKSRDPQSSACNEELHNTFVSHIINKRLLP